MQWMYLHLPYVDLSMMVAVYTADIKEYCKAPAFVQFSYIACQVAWMNGLVWSLDIVVQWRLEHVKKLVSHILTCYSNKFGIISHSQTTVPSNLWKSGENLVQTMGMLSLLEILRQM